MKTLAARLVEYGQPLVVEETQLPEAAAAGSGSRSASRSGSRSENGPDEVLIDMVYAGVNPIDRYRAQGAADRDAPLPRTLGGEGVGLLDGKPYVVFGHGVGRAGDGLWARQAVVPRAALIPVPGEVDLSQASAMGVAGVTAWRTVTELAAVGSDDVVLVLGASGGVGSTIVSLAKGLGAKVVAQSSDEAHTDWLTRRGADHVVVADAEHLAGELSDKLPGERPTAAFDPLGGGFTGAAISALAPRGRLVTFGTSAGPTGEVPLQTLYRSGLRIQGYAGLLDSDEAITASLAAAMDALAKGVFSVGVDKILPIESVNEAFDLLAHRAVNGKVVLDLRE